MPEVIDIGGGVLQRRAMVSKLKKLPKGEHNLMEHFGAATFVANAGPTIAFPSTGISYFEVHIDTFDSEYGGGYGLGSSTSSRDFILYGNTNNFNQPKFAITFLYDADKKEIHTTMDNGTWTDTLSDGFEDATGYGDLYWVFFTYSTNSPGNLVFDKAQWLHPEIPQNYIDQL